jgi:L-alanine-DL-glutamate epimerase-like enolase superfamily enzyme
MRIERISWEIKSPPPAKAGRVSLTERPVARPAELTLTVTTDGNLVGSSVTLLPAVGHRAVVAILEHDLAPLLTGDDLRRTEPLFRKVESHFGEVGFAGPASRAYAAIDLAMWDIQAKAAGQSLGDLLGGVRREPPFFVRDTGGPTRAADEVVRLAKPWIAKGAKGVLIEVGSGDVQADADRVRAVSDELGDDAWVGVDARGRYDLGTALALAHFFDDVGVGWFEEPLPTSDAAGYHRLADRMETTLAAGANCQSLRELISLAQTGAVRVLRPDPRKLGGLTPLLRLATIAESHHATIVPTGLAAVGEAICQGLTASPQFERESS